VNHLQGGTQSTPIAGNVLTRVLESESPMPSRLDLGGFERWPSAVVAAPDREFCTGAFSYRQRSLRPSKVGATASAGIQRDGGTSADCS
jgi:hypothetical protein